MPLISRWLAVRQSPLLPPTSSPRGDRSSSSTWQDASPPGDGAREGADGAGAGGASTLATGRELGAEQPEVSMDVHALLPSDTAPVDPLVAQLCFPEGARCVKCNPQSRPLPKFWSFVLTDEAGSRFYGFTLGFLSATVDSGPSLRHAALTAASEGMALLAPECIVVISPWPFVSLMKRVVSAAYTLRRNPAALEAYCGLLQRGLPPSVPPGVLLRLRGQGLRELAPLLDQDVESPGVDGNADGTERVGTGLCKVSEAELPSATVSALDMINVDVYCPSFLDLPLSGFPLRPLLAVLDVGSILTVISCLMCENRVLVVASDKALLTVACEGLLSLLYPFDWVNVYVPMLPSKLSAYLGAPFPFLIGVLAENVEQAITDGVLADDVVIVNLDSGGVQLREAQPVPLPTNPQDIIELNEAVLRIRAGKPVGELDADILAVAGMMDASLSVRRAGAVGAAATGAARVVGCETSVPDACVDDGLVFRSIVLRVVARAMAGYTEFLKTAPVPRRKGSKAAGSSRHGVATDKRRKSSTSTRRNTLQTTFDSARFVDAAAPTAREFLRQLVSTQSFSVFLDARCSRAAEYARNSCFDQVIRDPTHVEWLHRMNRGGVLVEWFTSVREAVATPLPLAKAGSAPPGVVSPPQPPRRRAAGDGGLTRRTSLPSIHVPESNARRPPEPPRRRALSDAGALEEHLEATPALTLERAIRETVMRTLSKTSSPATSVALVPVGGRPARPRSRTTSLGSDTSFDVEVIASNSDDSARARAPVVSAAVLLMQELTARFESVPELLILLCDVLDSDASRAADALGALNVAMTALRSLGHPVTPDLHARAVRLLRRWLLTKGLSVYCRLTESSEDGEEPVTPRLRPATDVERLSKQFAKYVDRWVAGDGVVSTSRGRADAALSHALSSLVRDEAASIGAEVSRCAQTAFPLSRRRKRASSPFGRSPLGPTGSMGSMGSMEGVSSDDGGGLGDAVHGWDEDDDDGDHSDSTSGSSDGVEDADLVHADVGVDTDLISVPHENLMTQALVEGSVLWPQVCSLVTEWEAEESGHHVLNVRTAPAEIEGEADTIRRKASRVASISIPSDGAHGRAERVRRSERDELRARHADAAAALSARLLQLAIDLVEVGYSTQTTAHVNVAGGAGVDAAASPASESSAQSASRVTRRSRRVHTHAEPHSHSHSHAHAHAHSHSQRLPTRNRVGSAAPSPLSRSMGASSADSVSVDSAASSPAVQFGPRFVARVCEAMADPEHGIEVRDRRVLLRKVKLSFVANAAVTWLVSNRFAENREAAVLLGKRMQKLKFIKWTSSAGEFDDCNRKFAFCFTREPTERMPLAILANAGRHDEVCRSVGLINLSLATKGLHAVHPHLFPEGPAKNAFWLNVHNLLCLHARLLFPRPTSSREMWDFFSKNTYRVGDHQYSALQIEYAVIRAAGSKPSSVVASFFAPKFGSNDPRSTASIKTYDPLLNFGLSYTLESMPRMRVHTAATLWEGLAEAAHEFLSSTISVEKRGRVLMLPAYPFSYYSGDFVKVAKELPAAVVALAGGKEALPEIAAAVGASPAIKVRYSGSVGDANFAPLVARPRGDIEGVDGSEGTEGGVDAGKAALGGAEGRPVSKSPGAGADTSPSSVSPREVAGEDSPLPRATDGTASAKTSSAPQDSAVGADKAAVADAAAAVADGSGLDAGQEVARRLSHHAEVTTGLLDELGDAL